MVGKWKNSLKPHEIDICERLTEAQMQKFNYAPVSVNDASADGSTTLTSVKRAMASLGARLTYPLHLAGAVAVNPRRAFVQLSALMRSKSA